LFVRAFAVGVVLILSLYACVRPSRTPLTEGGTYRLFVCKAGPCASPDDTTLVTHGLVVLAHSREFLSHLPDSVSHTLMRYAFGARPNGCYSLQRQVGNVTSYAGTSQVGGIHWRPATDRPGFLAFELYRSPDALHQVVLIPRYDRLEGIGESRGAGVAAVSWPPDTVVAWRVGPPNAAICEEAAYDEVRRLRQFAPPA